MTEAKITEFEWIRWVRDDVQFIRGWAHSKLEASAAYQEVKSDWLAIRAEWSRRREHWLK